MGGSSTTGVTSRRSRRPTWRGLGSCARFRYRPYFRICATDSRCPRDGRVIETIGRYNPQTEPSEIVIDEARAKHWLEHGAQPTNTVKKLLRVKGIS